MLAVFHRLEESRSLGMERKAGGKFHLKLNMTTRPIANKYREGKLKRTLKSELKVLEIAKGEPKGGEECLVAGLGRSACCKWRCRCMS